MASSGPIGRDLCRDVRNACTAARREPTIRGWAKTAHTGENDRWSLP